MVMASSSSSSSSMRSRMRNWISVRQHSNVSESLSSIPSIGRTTKLLIQDDVHGRVVLYDVFISHRGSDAKKYASKIYEDLERLGVKSFFDSEGIFKGENLSAIIVEAISTSRVLLVILTKGFAESAWCLEELSLMMEKMKEEKLRVGNMRNERSRLIFLPVFFGVEPGDLRDVSYGPFLKAFRAHKKGKEFSSRIVAKWEETLKEVADFPGPSLSDFKGRKDHLMKAIVQDVVKIVQDIDLEVAKYPVAVNEKVQEVDNLIVYAKSLQDRPCVLGIVGMTGIGKTAVVKQYFNAYKSNYRSACFIDGISAKAKTIGLASIQNMILRGVASLDEDINNVNKGIKLLKKRLQGVEVLLVLDGIDDMSQLEALMTPEVLSPSSAVLVTTTDTGLLKGIQNIVYYEVKKLDRSESGELLLMHAMQKQELIYPELLPYIEEYLNLCDGLPLSLEVVGQSLSGVTSKFIWENSLAKAYDILPYEIKKRFESYFENLHQVEKNVLTDIACFFDGEDFDLAISFWDASGVPGEKIINELGLKNAVTINVHRLSIHSQMKQCIIEAVEVDEKKGLKRKTHLWKPSDVQKALVQNSGLVNLEYLSLAVKRPVPVADANGISRSYITWKEYDNGILGPWPIDCFSNMSKLKFLMLEDACVVGELGRLPNGILWLQWRFFPYKFLHGDLCISNLWVLVLDGGTLSALWISNDPAEIPLLLRHLHLQGCVNLESLPVSIGMLIHLQVIILKGCRSLTFLPDELCNAMSLNQLDLSGCSALQYLPSNIGNLKNMQLLNLSGCVKLVSLPNSISDLVNMISLDLSGCINLTTAPCFSRTMTGLMHLDLFECGLLVRGAKASSSTMGAVDPINDIMKITNLNILKLSFRGYTSLPSGHWQLSSLIVLHIQGPDLLELPWSLGSLSALTTLILDGCFTLKYLVHSIGELKTLKYLTISSCGLLELPEEVGELRSLEELHIHNCKKLTTLPSSIGNLTMLLKVELVGNTRLCVSYEIFSNMSMLRVLVLDGCEVSDECFYMISQFCLSLTDLKLQALPISCVKLGEDSLLNLASLSIVSCNSLIEVEVFPKLRLLSIVSCLHLKLVSVPEGVVMWLRELTLNHCPELSVIQSIDMLQHLEKIDTVGCVKLHYIQGLELVRTLKEMHIFITFWGYASHGDDWLQKLQKCIYAPAMHFATKTVLNKDELFENFQKMNVMSSQHLVFQLPESTVPCGWIMIAFVSHDASKEFEESMKMLHDRRPGNEESEPPKHLSTSYKGSINLTLYDGMNPMTTIQEYPSAEVGEIIHFSIFTGDFWLCEQLKAGKTIIISSSSFVTLRAGWVRMLSVEEESNIEVIQSEFFECLKKEKEVGLKIAAEAEDYFYSLLLERRRANLSHYEPTDSSEEQVDSSKEQVEETLDLNLSTRTAEEMKDFQALDVANCQILRGYYLCTVAIQGEIFAPTWKKEQLLFLHDNVESLSHLQLEISSAMRDLIDTTIADTHTTCLQVTIKENFDSFPGILSHEFVHQPDFEELQKANALTVLQVVMQRCLDIENMTRRSEEIQLRKEMGRRIQFFADDDNGVGIFIPFISDSENDD